MSNRLTFSLASLIFLIAFGLVFVTTPVVAHEDPSVQSHDHPLNVEKPARDLNADGDTNDVGEAAVPAHNEHPMPTISLKPDAKDATPKKVSGNKVVIASITGSQTTAIDANEFVLVVDFDRDVASDSTTRAVARATETIPTFQFTTLVLNADNATISGGVSIAAATRVGTGTSADDSKFEFVVLVDSTAIPTGVADAALETVTVRLKLRTSADDGDNQTTESSVYSLATIPGLSEVPGGASKASEGVFEITLVSGLPADPPAPDDHKPTVTITPPTAAAANGDLVFTFAFNELLGNASNDLQASDIDVTGGTVTNVAQQTDKKVYKVTVTPTATPPQVSISLRADSVADVAGNFIDLAGSTPKGAMSAYDKVHPIVLSHKIAVASEVPTGGSDTETYLEFTFTFSEAIDKTTITVDAVDQGASHNAGFNRTYFFDATDTTGDATDSYTITVKVLDPKKATTIALKIGEKSVSDMAGNGLAASYTATQPAIANTAPVFVTDVIPPDDKQNLNWCEDQTRAAVVLPKAKDTEGDNLTYSLSANASGNVIPANPSPVPTSGLYWITIDSETRHLLGKAETADKGTYTWTATDANGLKTVTPKTITINVKPHQPPEKPTGFMAEKVDSASEHDPTMDRVKLSWDVPTSKTGWSNCIPDVDSYTLMVDKYDEVMEKFVTHSMSKSTFTVAADLTKADGKYVLALDKLSKGIYQFKITPHNLSKLASPDSDYATWKKTDGKRVVVASVPAAPEDLRAAVADGVYATVNWIKVPMAQERGAPIYDDKVAADHPDYDKQNKKRAMYYGPEISMNADKDFAGYVLYQVNQTTNVETRYSLLTEKSAKADDAAPISNYDHPTTRVGPLAEGEYVFRVTAMNVAGESARSLSTPYAHIRIVKTGATPPPVGGVPSALIASHDASTGTTSLASGQSIAKNGFAVVNASALPDIQRFYAEGGTISVLNTSGTSKDIVISEIMWGLNLRQPVNAGRAAEQFIELYNTTGAAIDLSTVTIKFDKSRVLPGSYAGNVILDQVSNVAGLGWLISNAPGQSGSIRLVGDPNTVQSVDLISMYRTINYERVEKTDYNADAAKNRAEQLKDFPNGSDLGKWAKSDPADTYAVSRIGSPGAKPFVPYQLITKSTIDRSVVVINEIGNNGNDSYDWLELHNVSGSEVNLKKWKVSQVTSDKKDTALVSFPDNNNHKIPAGEVLLIVNSDPAADMNHPIAAGVRINGGGAKTGTKARYYVDGNLKLANSGRTLLIVRNGGFKDVAGTLAIADSSKNFKTTLWPLVAWTEKPHGNVIDGDPDNKEEFRSGYVYKRNNKGGGYGEKHWGMAAWSGVGYKRAAANNNQNRGTPGYLDAGKVNVADLVASNATVTISEIMFDKGNSGNLPQWIELYNSSMTQPANISEWTLRIEHDRDADDVDIRTPEVRTNNFGGTAIIQPNQTVLIVSNTTRRTSRSAPGGIDFPASRIVDLSAQKDSRLEVDRYGKNGFTAANKYRFLSKTAFKVTLLDKGGKVVDTVGNLGADWEFPMSEEDNVRSSVIRRHGKNNGVGVDKGKRFDGTMADAWTLASELPLSEVRFNDTYYGSASDIGTPGYRGGGPLPVSLSKFRPERLESGDIVIRWVTESELNNAGFNILRSEKRDGQFTQINTSLIAGQGTTSEKTTYEWKDTTAKPNVVYYYQIQDVSLDGQVQTLRQSRLKGYLTPSGKLTTTWGDLKALQ